MTPNARGAFASAKTQYTLGQHLEALHKGQDDLADKMKALSDHLRRIEAELRTVKSETMQESAKAAREIQNDMSRRIDALVIQLAVAAQKNGAPVNLPPAVTTIPSALARSDE